MHVYTSICVYTMASMWAIKEQLVGVTFILLPHGTWILVSAHQDRQLVHLPGDPSC